uniref:Uncharacterized protein n=1 Tax=Xiphophorus couchianus TaxID=32473 RepID=A0A3B5LIH9_9TELE
MSRSDSREARSIGSGCLLGCAQNKARWVQETLSLNPPVVLAQCSGGTQQMSRSDSLSETTKRKPCKSAQCNPAGPNTRVKIMSGLNELTLKTVGGLNSQTRSRNILSAKCMEETKYK